MLTSVSKDVSNWVTGREVIECSASYGASFFTVLYTETYERTCNDSDMSNNNPICTDMQNTCDGNM